MPEVSVNVKWNKTVFENVPLNTDEPPTLFKAQLFALSNVPPERQKIMVKGGMLKDDTDWKKLDVKPGHTFMMMGTAELPAAAPEPTSTGPEDMEIDGPKEEAIVPGLTNLGNTCYMNATLQCLRVVPELQSALSVYKGTVTQDPANNVTVGMRDLLKLLHAASADDGVPPIIFLQLLRNAFPQFAQEGPHGPMQQDANECWSMIVRSLAQRLPAVDAGGQLTASSALATLTDTANASIGSDGVFRPKSLMEQYFAGVFRSTMKCEESDEPQTVSYEPFFQLTCHISQEVNYMSQGIREALEETITKRSESLGRDAKFKKSQRVDRLPGYLAVNFVRFFWKGKVNAKILRNVKFSATLDLFDICTPELQERLKPMREKFKQYEDAFVSNKLTDPTAGGKGKDKERDVPYYYNPPAAADLSKFPSFSFENDRGSNNSGFYELSAVLTHMGRSSDSGHYVGWVRTKGDNWLKYDDDKVSPVHTEDILKLSGGGDWHIAYVLLYSSRSLPTA